MEISDLNYCNYQDISSTDRLHGDMGQRRAGNNSKKAYCMLYLA